MINESTNDPSAVENTSSLEGGTEEEMNKDGENRVVDPETEVKDQDPTAEDQEAKESSNSVGPESNEEATDKVAEEPVEESQEAHVMPEVVANLLADEENLDSNLKNASPQELILVLENLALASDEFETVLEIGKKIRKHLEDAKGSDAGLDKDTLSRYQTAWAKFNRKRSTIMKERDQERAENSRIKEELLEELKKIVESGDVMLIQAVRDIQQRWRDTGFVLGKDVMSLKMRYSHYLDVFYNLRGQYNELRDMDKQHNLEEKLKLIEEVTALIPATADASRDIWKKNGSKMQELQEVWKTIGHVPKENEEVNEKYKELLDKFYSLRQEFFDKEDGERVENGKKKEALLAQLGPYTTFSGDKAKDWNRATKEVLAIQEEWNKIGPAPRASNKQLWKDFRKACDAFFSSKSDFFKKFDEVRTKNLELKKALCEKAEALKESTDWKATANALKKLQQEWREIGPVHERFSNKVWKRFRAACDEFFNRRDEAAGGTRAKEKENLAAKEEIVAKIKAMAEKGESEEKAIEFITSMEAEWSKIGHVPFADKNRINGEFRDAITALASKAGISDQSLRNVRLEAKLSSAGGGGRESIVKDELNKLRSRVRRIQETIDSYETNILMISKGKSGDALREQIQAKIDEEKARLKDLKAKMKAIREMGQKKEEAPKEEAPKEEAPKEEPASEESPAAEGEEPTEEKSEDSGEN